MGFNDISVGLRQVTPAVSADLHEQLGTGLYRTTIDWRYLERSPGTYEWDRYDELYARLLERGIRPLWVLAFAPRWLWDPLVICPGDPCFLPPDRARLAEWRELAGLVASRYPAAAGIELWNEPNELAFWRTGPDPGRYAELLREGHAGVKAANPSMPVISAGLSDRAHTDPGGMAMSNFIRGVVAAGGRQHLDGLGLHVYPRRQGAAKVRETLALARAAAGGPVPLWVTETGLTTSGTDPGMRVSEAEQANGLVEILRTLRAAEDVRVQVFHTLIEYPVSPLVPEAGYGVLRRDGTRKPAYCALHVELRIPGPC